MELKHWRLKKNEKTGEWLLPDCPKELLPVVAGILTILEEEGPITGYDSPMGLDKRLMVAYWRRFQKLEQALKSMEDFTEWWLHKAKYPDYIKRARIWLQEEELVTIPEHIRRIGQQKRESKQ